MVFFVCRLFLKRRILQTLISYSWDSLKSGSVAGIRNSESHKAVSELTSVSVIEGIVVLSFSLISLSTFDTSSRAGLLFMRSALPVPIDKFISGGFIRVGRLRSGERPCTGLWPVSGVYGVYTLVLALCWFKKSAEKFLSGIIASS